MQIDRVERQTGLDVGVMEKVRSWWVLRLPARETE
jgi:hypothetical protein